MLENRYMSVMEMAKYLRIGRTKAYTLAKDPTLPVIVIGKKILIDKQALDEVWLPNKHAQHAATRKKRRS